MTAEQVNDGGVASSAPPSSGVTVITTQDTQKRIRNAEIIAYNEEGTRIYYNDSLDTYFDVDPVPNTEMTVEYTASIYLNDSECRAQTRCFLQVIERVNLTTGEVSRIHSERVVGGRWHDVDKLNNSNYLIAGIRNSRVYELNTSTGLVQWAWWVDQDYPLMTHDSSGDPPDWTHLNDVNTLSDGRVMVSLRKQDQVVFIHPERGLLENQSLGEPGNHSILRDQHNPDYIAEVNGGPAILVADSSNSRAVEYQRQDGEWQQTWVYQSNRTQWIRDADRLPNGHTLLTGTHSDQVFEVDENGEVVWAVYVDQPYEAERIETGDESQGGPSALEANLTSKFPESSTEEQGPLAEFKSSVKSRLPPKLVNSLIFITPPWLSFYRFIAFTSIIGIMVIWPILELYWSDLQVVVQKPIRIR